MAYINEIPLPDSRAASLGELLGKTTFNRVSQSTDAMVQRKIDQLAKSHERKQFMEDVNQSGIFKDHPEVARILPLLEPKERGQLLNDFLIGQAKLGGFNTPQGTGAEMFAPGQQAQQTPGQPEQGTPQQQQKYTAGQILSAAKTTPGAEAAAIENEKKRSFKTQENITKAREQYNKQFTNQRAAANVAKKMLKILQENKSSFPGTTVGSLPGWFRNPWLTTNPKVRQYEALGNELVTLTAATRGGRPTQYGTKLEEAQKANVSQPLETQEEILQNIIDKGNKEADLIKYMHSLKDKNGKYDNDFEEKMQKYILKTDFPEEAAELEEQEEWLSNPLNYPEKFEPGTTLTENGINYINVGSKQWDEV